MQYLILLYIWQGRIEWNSTFTSCLIVKMLKTIWAEKCLHFQMQHWIIEISGNFPVVTRWNDVVCLQGNSTSNLRTHRVNLRPFSKGSTIDEMNKNSVFLLTNHQIKNVVFSLSCLVSYLLSPILDLRSNSTLTSNSITPEALSVTWKLLLVYCKLKIIRISSKSIMHLVTLTFIELEHLCNSKMSTYIKWHLENGYWYDILLTPRKWSLEEDVGKDDSD